MVAYTVCLNRILLHVGLCQHLIHAATTAQDKWEKNPVISGVPISFCWGGSTFQSCCWSRRLYAYTFAFVYLPDQTSAVLESEDRVYWILILDLFQCCKKRWMDTRWRLVIFSIRMGLVAIGLPATVWYTCDFWGPSEPFPLLKLPTSISIMKPDVVIARDSLYYIVQSCHVWKKNFLSKPFVKPSCSQSVWMRLWTTRSSGRCPCPRQGG